MVCRSNLTFSKAFRFRYLRQRAVNKYNNMDSRERKTDKSVEFRVTAKNTNFEFFRDWQRWKRWILCEIFWKEYPLFWRSYSGFGTVALCQSRSNFRRKLRKKYAKLLGNFCKWCVNCLSSKVLSVGIYNFMI